MPSPAADVTNAAGVGMTLRAAWPHLQAAAPAETAAWAPIQQRALLALVDHRDWRTAALAGLPADAAANSRSELQALDDLHTLNPPYPSTPPWRVVEPPSLAQLRAWYAEAEQRYGVPWRYLAAIHFVETQFGRINADSRTGAQGPMQFEPATWAEYGQGDVHDPHAAILAAARYLHASGAPARMDSAIYSYNPTRLYVDCVDVYAAMFGASSGLLLAHYEWAVYTWTARGLIYMPSVT